jgi:uncharacterized protein YjbI with pentapeptide repeats
MATERSIDVYRRLRQKRPSARLLATIPAVLAAAGLVIVTKSKSTSKWANVGGSLLSGAILAALVLLLEYRDRRRVADLERNQSARARRIETQLLLGTQRDHAGVDLRQVDLQGMHLRGKDLRHACLSGCDLRQVDFTGSDLSGAMLVGADLTGATLTGCRMTGAQLIGANLSATRASSEIGSPHRYIPIEPPTGPREIPADELQTLQAQIALRDGGVRAAAEIAVMAQHAAVRRLDFTDANLTGATLVGSNLSGACFRNANISGARFDHAVLAHTDLTNTRCDESVAESTIRSLRLQFASYGLKNSGELRHHVDDELWIMHSQDASLVTLTGANAGDSACAWMRDAAVMPAASATVANSHA